MSQIERLGRAVPGLASIRTYRRGWLRPDLLAGITVWAMLVPQSLGYSTLAGTPPVVGLYAAIGALGLYWLWGSCRELNVGAESTVAIMVATILGSKADTGSAHYVELAATLAIFVGLVLVLGGLFRVGRIADFLSRPVLAGYVAGSGVLIIVSQFQGLFGTQIDAEPYLTEIGAVLGNLDEVEWTSVVFGVVTIGVVFAFRRWVPTVPGALVAVIGSMIAVAVLSPDVIVVGQFPGGVPIPGVPDVAWRDAVSLIGPAFAVALLVYPDSVLTARSLGQLRGYRVDANREFFGVGAANIGAGLFGAFPVNGSQSRSFVLGEAGARSQVANLFALAMVLVTVLFLAPVFDYLPLATLAGVVIVAGIGLLDPAEFAVLWRYRRSEFWLALLTIAAVLGLGMLIGILVAVVLSLLAAVLRTSSPHVAELGQIPGTDTYRDVDDHDDAVIIPGLLIYRFDAPLFFANAAILHDDILRRISQADTPVERVVLDCESIHDIDSTGAQQLLELFDELEAKSVSIVLARVKTELLDELNTIGADAHLAGTGIHLEIDDAVAEFLDESTD